MKRKIVTLFVISIFTINLLTIHSCKHEPLSKGTDEELYNFAKETNGYNWFKNSDKQLAKSSGTGHSQPFLRTRYNTVASAKLDANGKIISGTSFPEGSVIVKELFDNSTTIGRYAVLYKNTTHKDADAKGWVWGYINADGSVAAKASDKGDACISCHSQTDNIDYMLMNKYFP